VTRPLFGISIAAAGAPVAAGARLARLHPNFVPTSWRQRWLRMRRSASPSLTELDRRTA
jgi:hypothetical protein